MALQVWLPLNKEGDFQNKGLVGDLTIQTTPTFVDGKLGKAMSSGQYLLSAEQTNKTLNNEAFSFACWIYPNQDTGTTKGCVLFGNGGGMTAPDNRRYWLYHYPTCNQLHLSWQNYDSNDAALSYVSGADLMPSYTWTHIVVTYSKNTRETKIYKNGELYHTISGSPIFTSPNYNYPAYAPVSDSTRYINDLRVYSHCLSPKEVKEISKGLVLHYPLNDPYVEGTTNLGNTSATYSTMPSGTPVDHNCWGGTDGTITYYHSGGYGNAPYKVYHRTSVGSGGFFNKTANDIVLEGNKTYTMSIYIKASYPVTLGRYNFNINRGSDNYYINMGSDTLYATTEWKRFSRTFTTTASEAGNYGEMSIIYSEGSDVNLDIYYSAFQIEEKDHATPYTPSSRNESTVYDCSGYSNNGTIIGSLSCSNDSPRYKISSEFNNIGINTSFTNYGLKEYSYSAWINLSAYHSEISCISIGGTYFTINTNGHLSGYAYGKSPAGYHSGNAVIPLNTWTHVALVWTPSYLIGYINGNEDFRVACSGTFTSTTLHTIGSEYADGSTRKFTGKISDLREYTTALSAEDVKELYNTSAAICNNGALMAYELEE